MENFILQQPLLVLFLVFAVSLYGLSRSADVLIDSAVAVSEKMGISQAVVGATIVSLGTTLPELSTSIAAVSQGSAEFALGNVVGSIITNTSIVLGIGALMGPLPVRRHIAKRVTFFSLAGVLLIAGSLFHFTGTSGRIPSGLGLVFLLLLPLYLWLSFKGDRNGKEESPEKKELGHGFLMVSFLKMFVGVLLVAISSNVLVATVKAGAERIGVSETVIAVTIVALGTSLPELGTTFKAARKGHGELAVGSVIGANIMNILLVLGTVIFLSPKGLEVGQTFFYAQYPVMLLIILIFNYFVYNTKKNEIDTREGLFLILVYILFLNLNILL